MPWVKAEQTQYLFTYFYLCRTNQQTLQQLIYVIRMLQVGPCFNYCLINTGW